MSRSGLYKYNWVVVKQDTRCIDSNERVAKKVEAMSQEKPDGFVPGLFTEEIPSVSYADDMDEGNVIKAEEIPSEEELRAQADAVIEEANRMAESILEDARSQAAAEAQEIKEEARNQGYQEGMANADRVLHEREKELLIREEELESAYTKRLEEMEPEMVDALTEIYEHIFNVELGQYRQIILQLIASTMRRVEENKNFLVHVAKEDYPFVSMNKKILQEAGGSGKANVEIIEDITLMKNQCMLETENGIFDCGLDTQMSELTRRLRLLSYERARE